MSRIDEDSTSIPRFGIVIPVRHMPRELPGAIDSIIDQKIEGRRVNTRGRQDVDIVVVVDDLDPETRAVLESYSGQLRWVEGDRRGQAGAVNKGLNLTRGELVKWVNADDRLLPGALDVMHRAFLVNPDAEFAYGDTAFLDANGIMVGEHLEPSYSRFILVYGHSLFADPACFWRRSLHDRVGPISEDTRYSLDYEFWVRLVRHRVKVIQVRRRVAAFKVTGNNQTVVNHKAMRREHYDMLVRHYPAWSVIPVGIRNTILSGLLLVARALKRFRSLVERGASERGVFSRLMATAPSETNGS